MSMELDTRIKTKYDIYENWVKNDPVLFKGELVASVIAPEDSSIEPVLLTKIGDGVSRFSTLPFTSANAADVYTWAKAETKPNYSSTEIGGLEKVTFNNGILSTTNGGTGRIDGTITQADKAVALTKDITLSIGNLSKTINGGSSVSWSLSDIGAAAASHTHSDYLPLTGGTVSGNLTVTGSLSATATSAKKATALATGRLLTIGNVGKSFDGTSNLSWTLADIGAAASNHTHDYLPTSGGILSGSLTVNGALTSELSLSAKRGIRVYGDAPCLDFHYNNADDYTTRIREESEGKLNLCGDLTMYGGLTIAPGYTLTMLKAFFSMSSGSFELGGVEHMITSSEYNTLLSLIDSI